ncbi:PREDICTED: PERQ amino acid-rich with GYF domain-containing protein 2 isoform X2 [Dufourea novaeangliae]|uniref:PERQ amino acid-rich with GYF domain-containing protein 2 isoform X2 n=1 Tax=Dufourea novaeangliae TaxID=178035 RepID=UPI0007670DEA|nr:PREDICTED: PERQ amino acid-rich with GYF domain-containing protein 2 isoform X2 [Dufourea novaeangliae]
MTDSMKFGPEWLRNLSADNCNNSGGGGGTTSLTAPRYQLAEHRYGREEMLILFDRNCKPPEPLTNFSTLYVEKSQLPLALIQMTEDETRMWNGGITHVTGQGRGGSVDRGGRGRNGRGGLYSSHYPRGVGFDDAADGRRIDSQPFPGRNRPFDRSQSERGWSERNGASDPGEWNGSTSPRKELARGASGSVVEGNWRRHRGGGTEDDDGWRKWGRSSWREGGSMDRDRLDRNEGDGEEGRSSGGRWEHRGSHRGSHDPSHHPPSRTARTWESNHHDNNHDNLPEWATENPSESGGSFDASGAFHGGMYSDDDEDGVVSAGGTQESRTRRVSEGSAVSTTKHGGRPLSYNATQGQPVSRGTSNSTSTINKDRPKPLHPINVKEDHVVEKERRSSSPPSTKPPGIVTSSDSSTPAKTPPASSESSQKRTSAATSTEQIEIGKVKSHDTRNNKSPSKVQAREEVQTEAKVDKIPPTVAKRQQPLQTEPKKGVVHGTGTEDVRQKGDDDLDRMKEEADALVAKLMADEESHREKTTAGVPPSIGNQPSTVPSTNGQEKWFYRDPQGEVQGPFLASEMAEWCKSGYFTARLMVRRTCDERYTTLGELMKISGRIPFTPGPPIPPLKLTDQVIPPAPNAVPAGLTPLPKSGIENPLLLLQYQHMKLLQNQQMLLRQLRTSAIAKLSQSEHWATLSPVEQNQLIYQYMIQDSEIPDVPPMSSNPFVPHLPSQTMNPVMQLFSQMQQAKSPQDTHLTSNPHSTTASHPPTMDPIQQLIQQMGGIQNIPGMQQTNINSTPPATQEDNPIKSLLRQLNVNANGHPQAPHMDTVWPQPPPQINPQFNAQNWLAQVGPIPAVPPGQMPSSLWDLQAKEIKTEQQILEEQNLRLQEDRKKEELKKQEEFQRQAEEEIAKRKKEEQARLAEEEIAKRKKEEQAKLAEEAKRKDEEKKRKDEEKRKQEEERKKKEEKKRKEEEKKREEKRRQEEENLRKKQEEEKRKKEELKKQEEKQKKEEEKRKKLEEEQRKQEEERMRKEAEARKQAEAEEQARRAEQRRREAEALRKLQERSKAPWAQAPRTPAPAIPAASLAEIQKLEREKKAEEQRFQQMMQQQLAQQKAIETAQEASTTDSSKNRLKFKWAEKATASSKPLQVKSLAQIQQEEQDRITKVKQERERQEKAGQKESTNVLLNAGIWGTASQCLNWTNSSTAGGGGPAWSNNIVSSGFWDDPTPVKSSTTSKQPAKQATTAKSPAANQQQQSNKMNKSKSKREEELVKKLFEQNTAKTDDFTQWCNKALSGLQVSVDIPTFVGFLRDIESAYEVKEYVRDYLGDNKQSSEFAKQFLEKRSKWRSAQRPQAQADDLCKPAPAVNPNAPAEFQEVKGKSKKPKKGKMYKVDNRILGFSVTAAPDRINVGDRDYGEDV